VCVSGGGGRGVYRKEIGMGRGGGGKNVFVSACEREHV